MEKEHYQLFAILALGIGTAALGGALGIRVGAQMMAASVNCGSPLIPQENCMAGLRAAANLMWLLFIGGSASMAAGFGIYRWFIDV